MKSQQAQQLLDEIDLAIKNIESFQDIIPLEESYLAKFLVVFICGMYEEIIEVILIEKFSTCNIQEAKKFITYNIRRYFQNPKIFTIANFLSRFNKQWGGIINNLPYQSKFALDSITTNKNHLVHSGSCSITLDEIKQYYIDSRIVIEKIDEIVL